MGCGCKNKSNTTQTSTQTSQNETIQRVQSQQPIQESIRKTVERYYK